MNVSSCRYGTPAFVSQPHFYGADPYYTDNVEGLNPVKEKHEMFMTMEPVIITISCTNKLKLKPIVKI